MEERNVVEGFILNQKGEILLQKKTLDYPLVPGGCWTFFGGQIENNEDPESALKREFGEEIGFDLDNFKLFKIDDYELKCGKFGKRHIYIIIFKGNLSDISLSEGAGFAFFDSSELNTIKLDSYCKKTLMEYFKLDFAL